MSTSDRSSPASSSSNKDNEEKNPGVPKKMTVLPTLITDEEGTAIPEAADGASMYQYRDFSNVPEEELERHPSAAPVPPANRGPVESSIRVQKFPVKLYAILAQKEFQDIITWMPHGRSWKVLKPNLFESLVMPLFFEYSNYHSFNRLVNAWSFRRISSGPDRGSYYHELFLRGKPYLQKYMRRLPKTHKKLPMKKDDEPDFYKMDKENPLPSVEDAPIPAGISIDTQSSLPGGYPPMGMGHPGMNPGMAPRFGGGMPIGAFDDYSTMGAGMIGMGASGMAGHMSMNAGTAMTGMMGMGGVGGGAPIMQHGLMHPGGISPAQRAILAQEQRALLGMESGIISGPMGIGMGGGISPMVGGMGPLRESQFGAAVPSGDMDYHRLRQIQQMQMLDRQMGGGTMPPMGGDPLDRMRTMEMRLGR